MSSSILEDPEPEVAEEVSEVGSEQQEEEVPVVLEEQGEKPQKGWHPRTRRRQSDVWRFFDRHEDFSKSCRVCNKMFSTTTATGALRKHLARHFGGQTEAVLATAQTASEVRISPGTSTVTVSTGLPVSGSGSAVSLSSTPRERKIIIPKGSALGLDEATSDIKPRTKSHVWKFFSKLEDGRSQCRYCAKIYSASVSTSGLQRHINHHNRLSEHEELKVPLKRNLPRQRKAFQLDTTDQYLRILIREHIPLAEAEKNLGALATSFVGKSVDSSTLNDLLQRLYAVKLESVAQFLNSWTGSVAISLELWNSEEKNAFLIVTAHLLTEKWKPIRVVLNCVILSPEEDAQVVADHLARIFSDFHVTSKILAITTGDSAVARAVEILKSGEDESFRSVIPINCILRKFETCVQPTLTFIHGQAESIRRFLRTIINSRKTADFRNTAALMIHDYHEIILDAPGVWVSTVSMINAALKMRPVIDDFIAANGEPFIEIADQDWKILEKCFELVENFLLAATDLDKTEFPALSNVLALVEFLVNGLTHIDISSAENNSWARLVLAEMKAETEALLASVTSDVYFFGTILDPRHKLSTLPASLNGVEIQQNLRTAFLRYLPAPAQPDASPVVTRSSTYQSGSLMSAILKKSHDSMSQPQIDELNQYLNTAVEQPEVDPLDWWDSHKKVYPYLSLMAKDYLNIPSTSQSSRQLIYKDERVGRLRNRLNASDLVSYVCLNSWNNFDFVKA